MTALMMLYFCTNALYWPNHAEKCTPNFLWLAHILQGLSGKYPAILNISRTGRVALMYLGSQSEKTLLRIREQPLYRGASQLAVRRC